jgi:hypothetical protein
LQGVFLLTILGPEIQTIYKPYWMKVPSVSKGVVNMIYRKSLAFYALLAAGVVIWLLTDDAVLIIIWIVISAAYQRKALQITNK